MIITLCYTLPSDILSNRHKPSHIRLSKRSDMTIRQSEISASQIAPPEMRDNTPNSQDYYTVEWAGLEPKTPCGRCN
eukprot:scaffold5837_cov98-Skeletonema_dohrnii-CCMP3373.AAC.11